LPNVMDGKFDTNPQFIPDYIYAGRALPEVREEEWNTSWMRMYGKKSPEPIRLSITSRCHLWAIAKPI